MPENFYRPSNGRTLNWYVRLVPPTSLKGRKGVREFRKSTGTADLRRAKFIGAQLIATQRAEWASLLRDAEGVPFDKRILTPALIESICARRLHHWMHMDDEVRYLGAGYTRETGKHLDEFSQGANDAARSVMRYGKASPDWNDVLETIDIWCEQIECPVDRAAPLYPKLIQAFTAGEVETFGRTIRRNAGEPAETPPRPMTVSSAVVAAAAIAKSLTWLGMAGAREMAHAIYEHQRATGIRKE